MPVEMHQLPLRVVLSVSCVVARGVLNSSVLKKLDALTKGLIDVTAIVLCTLIQVLAQGRQTDVTAMGLQMMMLRLAEIHPIIYYSFY